MIILVIILAITTCASYYLYIREKEKNIDVEQVNETTKKINKNLSEQSEKLEKNIKEQHENLQKLQNTYEQMVKDKEQIADASYEKYSQELEDEYNELFSDLFFHSQELAANIKQEQDKLNALKEKQLAYLREQQRKEEIRDKKDYYRLVLSALDIQDIEYLREVQKHIIKKDIIDKLIWSGYYKPAYDILINHLIQSKTAVCGIYKITSLKSEKSYIGQSTNIANRWSDHIKNAISSAPSSNKLYQEMRKYQPCNFTFEILEEVPRNKLDERELYWIDFYGTKDFGLNTTKGNNS